MLLDNLLPFSFLSLDENKNTASCTSKTKRKRRKHPKCSGCNKRIRSRFLLDAVDGTWHEGCLKCDVCGDCLYSLGVKMYYRNGAKLCWTDYLRYVNGKIRFQIKEYKSQNVRQYVWPKQEYSLFVPLLHVSQRKIGAFICFLYQMIKTSVNYCSSGVAGIP